MTLAPTSIPAPAETTLTRNTPGVSRAAASHPDTYNWSAPVEPGTCYATYVQPALRACGLPVSTPADPATGTSATSGVRLHDLRHTFAVISLSAGAHYMDVSNWLGHESFVTTLTIYAG